MEDIRMLTTATENEENELFKRLLIEANSNDYQTSLLTIFGRIIASVIVGLARKESEEQIKALLEEKEILLKEIHHRLKNNLQIISSLLNLEAEYLKDNQAIEVLKDSQMRIQSMALIHEKLYQSQDLARINFPDYIQDLVTNLLYLYNLNSSAITLKINVEDVLLVSDAAIPCGLIINELISNSLKHAFHQRESGEICIDFCSLEANVFTLTISDNGIGFAKDFDFETTQSLGLELVKGLTNQLKGNIHFSNNNGVEFKIMFSTKNL
ncbi:sensor histidine kinase [Nostoc sp.]|uniref:sensor histidine kinase n=1 Tax=Nostoc sp. TaxID=1180 RepID=UPI002FFAB8DD